MECRVDNLSMFSPLITLVTYQTIDEGLGNASYLWLLEIMNVIEDFFDLIWIGNDDFWCCVVSSQKKEFLPANNSLISNCSKLFLFSFQKLTIQTTFKIP